MLGNLVLSHYDAVKTPCCFPALQGWAVWTNLGMLFPLAPTVVPENLMVLRRASAAIQPLATTLPCFITWSGVTVVGYICSSYLCWFGGLMQVSATAEISQVRPGASPAGAPFSWQLLTPLPPCACPAGVQPREKPLEESAVPARKRSPSDSHYEKSSPEPSSPRSPTVLSPEVVSTIAANPGGRPKEVCWSWGVAGWGDMPPGKGMAWSAFTASIELRISDGSCGGGGS